MLLAKSRNRRATQLLLSVAAAACVAFHGFPGHAQAQSQRQPAKVPPPEHQLQPLIRSVEGPNLFRAYCASCHGVDAKGNGPAAPELKAKVPDLTLLTKKNGGRFPDARVRKIIMGDEILAVHGSREMPVWGPIFHQIEWDVDRGNVRLANLVTYLRSIQSAK
ncbi:MAG TPA: cytochrome c [Candidatus Polarisedimenticolia bacterium]|nr:cytochrome c [Candidatus Polarisedimenticolia bacterium]